MEKQPLSVSKSICAIPHDQLWFNWITCLLPGFHSTQKRLNIGKTVLDQERRRTGARIFGRSGTVGNNVVAAVEFSQARLHLAVIDVDGAADMCLSIRFCIPYIQKYRSSSVIGGFGIC